MSRLMRLVPVALLAVLALAMIACGPSTPEGKIAQIRAGYKIEINSWKPKAKEPPPADEAMDEGAEATDEAAGDEAGEDAVPEEVVAGPQLTDVLFDLVVFFRGRKSLPGVTVDLTHADSNEAEKGTYQVYVETPGIVNGDTQQAGFLLEDVPFEEGDVFALSVVEGVPEDLSKYREFSESAP